jgi:hypothetical protein
MRAALSLLATGALCVALPAAENPNAAAVHAEIRALRANEQGTLRQIHDWYGRLLKRDRWTEETLREEHRALTQHEKALLAVAQTEQARRAIHDH